MALAITLTTLSTANADVLSFACGKGTYSVESSTSTITKSTGCTGDLIIDSSVKKIANFAFYNQNLTSVVIPNSVTEIGYNAFKYNFDLKSVVISNSITIIESDTFSGVDLTSVVIPDSVVKIDRYAFFSNDKLSSIKFGKSLIEIGDGAFYGAAFVNLDIPDTVTTIASSAFSQNNKLKSIIYCGPAAASLPTAPNCPADRKAIADAVKKAAADKAAADKAAADARAAADRAAAEARAAADRAAAEARAAADRAATQAAQDAKKLTITCKKGIESRQVIGESPVCPTGFTNALDIHLTFKAYSNCKLYKKDSSIAGVALLDNGATLKFSYAGKYSSVSASAASYSDVACSLSVMNAPSFVTAQIDTTRALDGLQKATWGKLSAFWTYHPDSGLNISFNSVEQFSQTDLNAEVSKATAAATKKTTITCIKGKLTKKVTAVKPKCPTGYQKQ